MKKKKKEQIHSEWRNVPLHKWGLIDRSKGNIPGILLTLKRAFTPKYHRFTCEAICYYKKRKKRKERKTIELQACIKQTKKQPNKGF